LQLAPKVVSQAVVCGPEGAILPQPSAHRRNVGRATRTPLHARTGDAEAVADDRERAGASSPARSSRRAIVAPTCPAFHFLRQPRAFHTPRRIGFGGSHACPRRVARALTRTQGLRALPTVATWQDYKRALAQGWLSDA
jgi:hypothetical protein